MNKAFETALHYIGTKEHTEKGEHNPQIVEMFSKIGHSWVKDDETAWCAAFVNFCLVINGLKQTGKLNARSFLKYAKKTDKPQTGDIVVFWRSSRNSWKGHVGFYVSEDEENIYCLGGNQSNSVNITAYAKYRLLGYRRIENNSPLSIQISSIIQSEVKEAKQTIQTILNNVEANIKDLTR